MGNSIFYTDGKFYLGNNSYANSMFSRDGKVVALGHMEEIGEYKNEADKIVYMEEKYIYPDYTGFIEEVEYDFYETGDELLTLYDKKMAKKVTSGKEMPGFKLGDESTMAVYSSNLMKLVPGKTMEVRRLIVEDKVIYDEAEYLEEQWYELMLTQQF